MLRINALKININTNKGLYGVDITFEKSLNIIRGNNSSGKSTIFQSILYCLGMEELLGSKNDKAMQSVLKHEVLNEHGEKEAIVIESQILLEIENEKKITIERYIKSENKDPKLVKVYHGAMLSENQKELKYEEMFVHDKGSASNINYGYFAFLEKFLGYSLPEVKYNDGAFRKLYLQTIFPSFVIEQKVGWSDFLATIPYFQLREKEKRAIEFILNLDSWKNEERRQEIKQEKLELQNQWRDLYDKLKDLARRSSCDVMGLEDRPFALNSTDPIYLMHNSPEESITLKDYVVSLEEQLNLLEMSEIPKVEEIAKEIEEELVATTQRHNEYTVHYRTLESRRSSLNSNLTSIKERFIQIEEELVQNKHHLKVKKLGAENDLQIAKDFCPTCHHGLNDTLLPVDSKQIPMTIEENIGYLESQKAMAKTYIQNHEKELDTIDKKTKNLEFAISETRSKIRSLKRDLVSDDRLPSVDLIEEKVRLKNKVDFFNDILQKVEPIKDQLQVFGNEWISLIGKENDLPKDSFSVADKEKLKNLHYSFISLLKRYGYKSKSLNDIRISYDKLLPVANNLYNIRFDSSASDLVRAIWAYTISLHKVSEQESGNHPMCIMLDEPGTQDTANESLKAMLNDLANAKLQSLVFASFKQSDNDFSESTSGIDFNLIESTKAKYIQKTER